MTTISDTGFRVPESGDLPWHFSDPDRAAAFRAICKSWDRTPFVEIHDGHQGVKGPGGGNDCVGFVEDTFFETGEFPHFHFPRCAADYRTHAHNDKIVRFLRGTHQDLQSQQLAALFIELTNLDELVPIARWPDKPVTDTGLMTGDILIIKSPIPGVWHLPVMQDDRTFMHCAYPLGVTEADITQADYRSRLKFVFRPRLRMTKGEERL